MKLSEHFYLSEFVKSELASRFNIKNEPGSLAISKLQALVTHVLEPIRDHFNLPVVISSGYRCLELNRRIGGSAKSQHTLGEAADIEIPGISNIDLFQVIKSNLNFDQLILEFYEEGKPGSGWIHVSYRSVKENRNQLLRASKEHGKVVYKEVV